MLQSVRAFLGWWNGDWAYARYLAHHAQAHPDQAPLSRKDYCAAEIKRKWSGISRCC